MTIRFHQVLDRRTRSVKALLAAALVSGLTLLWLVPPENSLFPACAFHELTGHSCLTCGLTRSLHAIAHGDVVASLGYHMMGPAIFLCAILALGVLFVEAISGRKMRVAEMGAARKRIAVPIAVVWLVYWGARLVFELMA